VPNCVLLGMQVTRMVLIPAVAFLCGCGSPRVDLPPNTAGTTPVSILLLQFKSSTPSLGDATTLQLRKLLDQKRGYSPMGVQDAARRLPKVDFKRDLDCVRGRQLAVAIDSDYMACGSIEQVTAAIYTIDITVLHTRSNSSIVVHGISRPTVEDAVQEIARRITRFVEEDMVR
jgi:hypothetical protein